MASSRTFWGLLIAALLVAASAIAPATASAAASTVVTTGGVSGLTSTSVVLHGNIQTATPAQYYFEYGPSPTNGSSGSFTRTAQVGPGNHNVSANVDGLSPGVTYHYQLFAIGQYDQSPTGGGDRTFTTPLSPGSIATTGDATSITARSATLNGVVNTNNPNSVWFFQYGRSTAYDHSTPPQTVGAKGLTFVSWRINNLTPNTIYHFRLVVQGQQNGNDKTFKTHKPSGQARLKSHRLRVRHGVVSIPWACSGPGGSKCAARVSLKTRLHGATVGCASGNLNMSAGHSRTMHVRLRPACEKAQRKARNHRRAGTLQAIFSTEQKPIKTKVTLVGT